MARCWGSRQEMVGDIRLWGTQYPQACLAFPPWPVSAKGPWASSQVGHVVLHIAVFPRKYQVGSPTSLPISWVTGTMTGHEEVCGKAASGLGSLVWLRPQPRATCFCVTALPRSLTRLGRFCTSQVRRCRKRARFVHEMTTRVLNGYGCGIRGQQFRVHRESCPRCLPCPMPLSACPH